MTAVHQITGVDETAVQLSRARAQIAALEQLLEVHEQASIEQSTRLEQTLTERESLLQAERNARAELVESQARLRIALDAGRMGTWEWNIVENRVIWSPEEERLYGVAPGSFTGTLEEYRARIHPDDCDQSLQLVRNAVEHRAETHHVLHRIVRQDGEVRWLDSHGRFIYAHDGQPLRLVGVSTDVTDQQLARERLQALQRQVERERQRLQEVLMQAPAAITVTEGPEHVVVMQNEMSRQLIGGRDIVGMRTIDILPGAASQAFVALQDEVFRTGQPFVGREMPVRFDRAAGDRPTESFFDFVYHPLRNEDGAVYGILSHAVEVTEQVRARQLVEAQVRDLARLSAELERSNRDLDQFAYVASHDLKAPLRGIANLAQWIEEDLGDRIGGESREHMRLLKGRATRMEALIEGILMYSRAGRISDRVEEVDVGALLTETIALLSPPDEASVRVDGEMPSLTTERVPLQQVFLNLISNALKYSDRPDTRVDVRVCDSEGAFVCFDVADNGPGIEPQFQEKIWQIFQTLAPRDKVEGTGIGLSVVKKLVETRGGRVSVTSAPGRGSTFSFTWPRRPRMAE